MDNEVEERTTYITGDVLLECGHVLHFDIATPHKQEMLWCRRHRAESPVKQVFTGKKFRVRCNTCNYTRGKAGRIEADRASVNHRLKRGFTHEVVILNSEGKIIYTFAGKEQDELELPPGAEDVPPF